VVAGGGAKAREPVPALEEGGVGLVGPSQHLLEGGERSASETFGIGGAAGLEFVCLRRVAQADTSTAERLNALLKPSVVQAAEVPQHGVERRGLRAIGPEPVFVRSQRHRQIVPDLFSGAIAEPHSPFA